MAQNTLTIALSKGRILKETLPLLAAADIHPLDAPDSSRKLILDTNHPHIKLLAVRATDAPTYVNYGTADLGVAGKDVLMEIEGENLYELVDLGIARCRLMVAGRPDHAPAGHRLRVATKYVRSAQRYFAEKGEQVELIKLYGSMELAPLVGLSDVIVDLVDTGNTLKANGLAPMEHIADISSRLIVNQHAYKLKHDMIRELVQHIQEAVNHG